MIGIIVAMPDERDAILKIMSIESSEVIHSVNFFEGTINKKKCVLAVSGLGKIKAARCTELMIVKYKMDQDPSSKIINIGTSGCLNPKLGIGDIVIAERCVQLDMDITALTRPDGSDFKKGDFYEDLDRYIYADEKLVTLCTSIINQVTKNEDIKFKVIVGTIATGDTFINDPDIKLKNHFEFNADCDEMEGASIAKVCMDAGVPFGIIRSISDKPKDESICDYDKFKYLASSRCANFLDRLTQIL